MKRWTIRIRGGRRRLAGLSLALLAGLLAPASGSAAVPTGHNPSGLPAASCFWTGPFTAADPRTNYAFPGTEITYWGAKFATPPGARVILHGRYAHARFQSLNAYTDGAATNSLPDTATRPDRGSTNPYVEGHRRDRRRRDYTVEVLPSDPPAEPARNTLYAAADPAAGTYQDIIYRVYVPDRGRSLAGGVGLPEPELRLADGTRLEGQAMCEALNSNHDYRPTLLSQSTQDALVNWPGKDPATNPALPEIEFEKFFNLSYSLAAFKTPAEQATTSAEPIGTQYNNNDARYMTGAYSFVYGPVLALRGRLPTTPRTRQSQAVMRGGQLRVWDMCVIQSLVTTRTHACVFDQQLRFQDPRRRRYLIVVAQTGDRPANARRRCGVTWLEADPEGDGAGRPSAGTLLTRNVLPASDFERSSFAVSEPNTAAEVMGRFYPRGEYLEVGEFESHGCPFRWNRGGP